MMITPFGSFERILRNSNDVCLVSTVWAGDRNCYETAIATPKTHDLPKPIKWYNTLEEAKKGHAEIVKRMEKKYGILPPANI